MSFEKYFTHLIEEKKDYKSFNCSLHRNQDESLVFEIEIRAYSKEQARFKFQEFLRRKYPEYLNDNLYWILVKEIKIITTTTTFDPQKYWWNKD
jgi:hypothetical protein